jgi:CRISPR type III-B/RAMP module-associated protein Cmr5
MKNREQIRAKNALLAVEGGMKGKGIQDGDALSGFPALVVNNGLLATIAFSLKQGQGYQEVCDAIACHLADKDIALLAAANANTMALLKHLTENDSIQLRLCTAETLAFLNYLRRFAKAALRT